MPSIAETEFQFLQVSRDHTGLNARGKHASVLANAGKARDAENQGRNRPCDCGEAPHYA
jgi:hypothetical protein